MHLCLSCFFSCSTWLAVLSLLADRIHQGVPDRPLHVDPGNIISRPITDSGSWLELFGLWAWVFSGANGAAPDFLYTAEAGVFAGNPYAWGFTRQQRRRLHVARLARRSRRGSSSSSLVSFCGARRPH